jgi:hypothetical protein
MVQKNVYGTGIELRAFWTAGIPTLHSRESAVNH